MRSMIAVIGAAVALGVLPVTATAGPAPTPAQTDFGVTLDGPSETSVGGHATYTMEVTNAGPDKEEAKLRFTKGHGATSFEDGQPVRTISQSTTKGDCETDPLGVICRFGQLAPGAKAKVEVVLKVFAEDEPKLLAQATVAPELSDAADPNPANDHAEVTTPLRDPITVDGVPDNCATHPFKVKVVTDVPKSKKTKVLIDNKVLDTSSSSKLSVTVKPSDLDKGLHKLSVVVQGGGGPALASLTRKFKTC
ncbi:MAG: hypothetical protein QOI10_3483 [Solirubrobacterales bacterium]|jgi:hypothetical protein|nr:hypothetical protein [Solirubrobacterales bacterium]